ncbi:M56 family metallopeptidase [Kordia sp.]|uniref:M56 family metallopeptidase n=1 Tax=Kordia sp. TaxID=1965332 RepID=UPI003B5AF62B
MIAYFIKVVAFQLLFLVAYDLFLKKETFFNWNRIYLICSSLISFALPFIKLESFQNAVPQEYVILLPEIVLTPEVAVAPIEPVWNWFLIIGITVSSILFIYKISELLRLRFKGRFVKRTNYTVILIPKSTVAFSIFRYVFIGDDIHESKLEDILLHELVHVREKHSLDLLYFELLRILCWFNPLVYIYQKRISELHEYIADAAIVQDKNKSDYYEKLLAEVFQTQQFSFTNQFFKHSLIKKRIIMLTKQKSREILKLKYLVLVPVLILSLLYTSCEETTIADTEDNTETVDKEEKTALLKDLLRELNKLNATLEGNQILSEEQYKEQSETLEKIAALISEQDEEFAVNFSKAKSYEEYVKARKLGIAEKSDYTKVEQEAVAFSVIDQAPVFPGCENEGTQKEIKKCSSQNVARHVNMEFDTKLAEGLGLTGVNKIFAQFVIDENGDIAGVNARAPHPALKTETERVIRTLPKFSPGMKDGKAVSVKYVLPIVFKIQE